MCRQTRGSWPSTSSAGQPRLRSVQPRIAVDARISDLERIGQGSPFAVTPDGSRFIVSTAADSAVPITVVLNWQALLEK